MIHQHFFVVQPQEAAGGADKRYDDERSGVVRVRIELDVCPRSLAHPEASACRRRLGNPDSGKRRAAARGSSWAITGLILDVGRLSTCPRVSRERTTLRAEQPALD